MLEKERSYCFETNKTLGFKNTFETKGQRPVVGQAADPGGHGFEPRPDRARCKLPPKCHPRFWGPSGKAKNILFIL